MVLAGGDGRCSPVISSFLGGPPFPVLARADACGVRADGDRRLVLAADPQGSAVRIVRQDGAVSVELADQRGRAVRAGQLRLAAVPGLAAAARRMAIAARCGRIWSSRT